MGIVRKKSVDSEDRPSSTTSVGSNRRSSSRHNPTPIVISNSKHPPTSSTSKSKITLGSVRASKTERDATPKYVVRNSTSGSTCDASLSTCTFEGYDDMSHFAMSVGDDESFQTPEGRRTRGCGHLDRNPRRFRPGEGGTRLRNRRYPDRIDELNTHQHTAIITDMKQHERKFSQSSESTSPTSNANKRCNSYDASLGNEGDHSALKGLGRMIHDKAAEHLKVSPN